MSRFRAFIVDDEPPARRRLAELLERSPDVELAGEFDSGADARRALATDPPDLVFLDVRMPEVDGFDVLDGIESSRSPAVIFVTAYQQHAVRAFDAEAVDYLLKPFSDERFDAALERALSRLQSRRSAELGEKLLKLVDEPNAFCRRIVVRSGSRTAFVAVDEILWIEAQGIYVTLHTANETHLLRESLSRLEAELDPDRFARIHRSTIVALEQVRELRGEPSGPGKAILKDGTALAVSRRHRPELMQRLLRR